MELRVPKQVHPTLLIDELAALPELAPLAVGGEAPLLPFTLGVDEARGEVVIEIPETVDPARVTAVVEAHVLPAADPELVEISRILNTPDAEITDGEFKWVGLAVMRRQVRKFGL